MSEQSNIIPIFECEGSFLNLIADLVIKGGRKDEARVVYNAEGLAIRVLDPSHVAMIDIALTPGCFEKWHVEDEVIMVIDFLRLRQITKSLGSRASVKFSYNVTEKNCIIQVGKAKVSLGLLDPIELTEHAIPGITFAASLTLPLDDMLIALKGIALVDELVTLDGDSEGFTVSAHKGKESAEIKFPADEYEIEFVEQLENDESYSSQFAQDYLYEALKGLKCETIKLNFGTDVPVLINFDIGDGGKGIYFLAPRVEGDD